MTLGAAQTHGPMKMVLEVWIQGRRMSALVDSGAMGNYISPETVNHHRLPWNKKSQPYKLYDIEGNVFGYNDGNIDAETDHLTMQIQGHTEQILLDVMDLSEYDVVLGHPWLRESNPLIDWRTGQLRWVDTAMQQQQLHPEKTNIRGNLVKDQVTDYTSVNNDQSKYREGLQPETHKSRPKKQKEERQIRKTVQMARRNLEEVERYLRAAQREKPKEESTEDRMKKIPKEYQVYEQLFKEELETGLPEHSQWDCEIDLVEGTTPKFHKIYNLNESQLQTLREYLEDNLRKGYIRLSKSEAGHPVMFVPKKNGKLRLVVDYRALNNITVKDRTPLPLISELRDRFQGKSWFTALDLKGAYNLIRIKPGDEWKTAFRTKFGLYEYLVMPFGLTNAPAAFQKMINNVLRENLDIFVVAYLDDILIFSGTEEEHRKHVHWVLDTLQKAKLLVEPTKCEFHTHEVNFLGYTIRPNEVAMEKSKIDAVREWPKPTNVKEVQSFVGFANYYRRFIKNFGMIASPLTNLTKKTEEFKWTDECQHAFERLKDTIVSDTVLSQYDPKKPVELETDASDFAMGATVGQRDDEGRMRPIAFASKKLHGAELNYPIYDKEFMAIIFGFKEFRHYLIGNMHKVKVYTDHKNIAYFASTQQLNGRQIRWAEYLSEFNYEIIHRKGSENGRADALSRRTDYDKKIKEKAQGQLFELNPEGHLQQRTTLGTIQYKLEPSFSHYKEIREETKKLEKDDIPGEVAEITDGLPITCSDRVWIPPELRHNIIKEIHDHPIAGHEGIRKTLARVKRTYDYRGIKKDVGRIVNECEECARSKAARHKPYGELKPLPVPAKPWESIAFDHITKLPKSKEITSQQEYDSIFVITDRLTKYGYFIPYQEATDAEVLAYTVLKTVVANHGLPDEVITDRGTTFASKFWQALTAQLGVNHKLSTAYHPQTDGQTERLNQTLEQYLRCYINYEQDDWASKLPLAQLAYNSAPTESTKITPFYANYGFEPEIDKAPRVGPLAEKAMLTADQLKSLHTAMGKELEYVRQRMATYYNQKRLKGPIFKRGEMVYLLRKNFKTTRPSPKLDYKKVGPFKVEEVISDTNYRLSLPSSMRMHPVFHISLLERAPQNAKQQIDIEVYEEEYEPERIVDKQTMDGEIKYLIKWKGYDATENTWEPAKHLTNCRPLLRQFHQRGLARQILRSNQ
jgi:hypothetical protein